MKLKQLLSVAVLATFGASSAWADNVTFTPTDATYINAGEADANHNGEPIMANLSKISGGKLTDQLSAYGGSDVAIVKFDATELPEGCTITAATVNFHSQCTVASKNSQIAIVPFGTDWSASTATWNSIDLSANSASVTNLFYSDANNGADQSYDVKTLLTNDEDKIIAFAIFTNTGRQQEISNLELNVEYTTEVLNEYHYTINAVAGETVLKQLAEGDAYENDNYSVNALSYCIEHDGTWYKLDDGDAAGYKKTFTMGTSDETQNVFYTEASDILYFFEAESILSRSYGNAGGGYSGGTSAGVYTGATLTMPEIAAGSYTVTVSSTVRRTNEDIFNVEISTDGENWEETGNTIVLTSNEAGDYSANVVLPADGSIRLVEAKSQNMCHYVDYVVLTECQPADDSAADINGDGEVNVADAVALITEIIGGNTDSKYDLDGNGEVDVKDAEEVINIYLKNK